MSETSSPVRHFDYINALRGYAILMVIAVHTATAFPDLPNWLARILSQGARGVQLFFVTSALTLSMSWVARKETAANFYTRRLFRIAPMFWVAIIFFVWLNGTGPSTYAPDGIGFKHIAMTALLVQGFWPDTISSVVPGGWSVADEVIFYALFPLIVPPLLRARWRSLIIVAVGAVVLGPRLSGLFENGFSNLWPGLESVSGNYFRLWWFPRQLPCFIFGIMLFRLSAEGRAIPVSVARAGCFLAIALMLFVPFLDSVKYALPLGLVTTYGIVFSLFAFSLMCWPNSPLIGRPIEWIGKVSYSAYFIHFVTLRIMPLLPSTGWPAADMAYMFCIQVLVTVGLSSLTYLMIEKPMIRLGGVLIAARSIPRFRQNNMQASSLKKTSET
jgi:peptidoglycan/LPS O-acetylase OafA/YrhL